jgi:nicotinamide-nucleotide amidase
MPDTAAAVVEALRRRGETAATAESLTGGLVCATLVDVPGASDVVRGGVVAYATDLKSSLLGVDAELIERLGTVDPAVAEAMAEGVQRSLQATWGIATTGVAGPGPSEGRDVGTVYVAVAGPDGTVSNGLSLPGGRSDIRRKAVAECLSLLLDRLEEQSAITRS